MKARLVIASNNEKKKRELLQIIGDLDLEIATLKEFPQAPVVEEDGLTFQENAVKKAREIAEFTGCLTLADDSGLEVDALGGLPGVHSARFAGEPSDDERNNRKLLEMLEGVPAQERTARFRCVIAIAFPDGRVETAEGTCEGRIGFEPRGQGGFGYDPLFIPDGYDLTFAELNPEVKNSISHRGKALQKAIKLLQSIHSG
ncbi:MAG: XTP/dITP diphosphatase [Syntrophomonadaceae bacterium]|nr:XTP/dITP diphosphatase [Syntrophomonadaceae bacterium]